MLRLPSRRLGTPSTPSGPIRKAPASSGLPAARPQRPPSAKPPSLQQSLFKHAGSRFSSLGRRPLFHLSALPSAAPVSPPPSPPSALSPYDLAAVPHARLEHAATVVQKIQRGHRARSCVRRGDGRQEGQGEDSMPRVVRASLGAVIFGGVHIDPDATCTTEVTPRLVALQLAPPLQPSPAMMAAIEQRQATLDAQARADAADNTPPLAEVPWEEKKALDAPTDNHADHAVQQSPEELGIAPFVVDAEVGSPDPITGEAKVLVRVLTKAGVQPASKAVRPSLFLQTGTAPDRVAQSPRLQARVHAASKAAEKLTEAMASAGMTDSIKYLDAGTTRVSLADIRASQVMHTPRGARVVARTVRLPTSFPPPRPAKSKLTRSVSKGVFVVAQPQLLPRAVAADTHAMSAGTTGHSQGHSEGTSEPLYLNPTCLELYLSDAEFQDTFGMGKEAFYGLKQWKQRQLKKQAGIF
jgi:hypothetical protein